MKKTLLYAMVLATSLVSCTGDYDDWAQPQQNAQESAISYNNPKVDEVGVIDFAQFGDAQAVKVCSITAPSATASTYKATGKYTLVIDGQEYAIDANGKMSVSDLVAIVEGKYGKRPTQRDIDASIVTYLTNGNETLKAETAFQIHALPVAPEIYEHFYLIGAPSAWDPTCTTMPFNHSGKDVYDDPVFTVMFPATEGDTWFAFADDKTVETASWSNVFAAREGNGKNLVGETGSLCRRNELSSDAGDGSFKVTVNGDAKYIKVTVNLLDATYKIEKLNFAQFVYFIGATDGWASSDQKLESPNYDGVYTGYVYVADPNGWGLDCKFQRTAGSWDNEINSGTFSAISGDFTDGGGNIHANAGEGVYHVKMDLGAGTLEATKVEYMGITGDFTGWNEGVEMTWNATEYCFEASAAVTTSGWKFRVNGLTDSSWKLNLGGSLENLTQDGANLSVAGSTVKLYPTRKTSNSIYATVE